MVERSERADRILDAAGELMLRMGYRKVTVGDIARRARIGKGTIYLHWPTKEQLFQALLLRESIALLEEQLEVLRRDPEEVRPHRLVRSTFLSTQRRPLVRAMFSDDAELLGNLKESSAYSQKMLANEHYFQLMIEHGLLRDDFENLPYAMQATLAGFFLVDADMPEPDLEAKADAFALTVRAAFEPPGEPDSANLAALRDRLIALFDDLSSAYRKNIY